MPDWMRTLGSLRPAKWDILLLPCALLLGFGTLFAVLGLVRFARMERA